MLWMATAEAVLLLLLIYTATTLAVGVSGYLELAARVAKSNPNLLAMSPSFESQSKPGQMKLSKG